MDIGGMRARRTAYGSQDLAQRAGLQAPGGKVAGANVLHLARGRDGPATAATARRAVRHLDQARGAADRQVSQALQASGRAPDRRPQDVHGPVAGRQRGTGVHFDGTARNKLRNDLLLSQIAAHFGKADAGQGSAAASVPYFPNLWANRAGDPAGFALVAEYAHRNQSETDVAFLRAVDTLQKDPGIEGARQLLQTFIEPLPVDDFGIEIAVPGRSVLNMTSDGARKNLLVTVNAAIGKAMRSGDPADVQALGALFDGAARQAAGSVAKNLNTLTGDLRRWASDQAKEGGTVSRTMAG